MFKKIVFIILYLFLIKNSYSQENKFGLQCNYISNIIFNNINYEENNFLITKNMNYGVDFGMIIHKNIYNKSQKSFFGFESGIIYSNIKYRTSLDFIINNVHQENNYFIENNLRSYNIPSVFIIKIKLKKNIFGEFGFGNTFTIFPSDMYSEYENNGIFINNEFYEISYYTNRIQNNLTISLGLNYKNKNNDIYFGVKILRPYKKSGFSEIIFNHDITGEQNIIIDLYNRLFNFELKYFLN